MESFDTLMGHLSPEEQGVVRSLLDAIYPDVSSSLDVPTTRWACGLLLQSPNVPLPMRPNIERALHAKRYEQITAAVTAGLMDDRVHDEIERRYRREPWPKLGLFPPEWHYGKSLIQRLPRLTGSASPTPPGAAAR